MNTPSLRFRMTSLILLAVTTMTACEVVADDSSAGRSAVVKAGQPGDGYFVSSAAR